MYIAPTHAYTAIGSNRLLSLWFPLQVACPPHPFNWFEAAPMGYSD